MWLEVKRMHIDANRKRAKPFNDFALLFQINCIISTFNLYHFIHIHVIINFFKSESE